MTEKERVRQHVLNEIVQPPPQTKRQKLAAAVTLLTERPAGMSYEAYKILRGEQAKAIKKCKRP